MVTLTSLWAPIVISAVIIFIASFLAWMVLPHHKKDWRSLPDEDAFGAALGSIKVSPGQYMFPHCDSSEEMKSEAFKKKWADGPHGTLNVWSSAPSMPRNLILTFIFYLVVGVFVGYLCAIALSAGAEYMVVFRFAGTAAIAAYVLGVIPNAIWFGRPLRATVMDVIDGVVYGLLTAGVFAWLWPGA